MSYTSADLSDPAVLALAKKGQPCHRCLRAGARAFQRLVIVATRDEGRLEHIEATNRGNPDRPLAPGEIRDKFAANAATVLPSDRIGRVLKWLDAMQEQPDVSGLVRLCVAA